MHSAEFIRQPEPADIDELCGWAGLFSGGKLLVSLAPEQVDDTAIRRLAAAGIVVSGAHSAAGFERTLTAIAAGLSGFTHLFNAMRSLDSR